MDEEGFAEEGIQPNRTRSPSNLLCVCVFPLQFRFFVPLLCQFFPLRFRFAFYRNSTCLFVPKLVIIKQSFIVRVCDLINFRFYAKTESESESESDILGVV